MNRDHLFIIAVALRILCGSLRAMGAGNDLPPPSEAYVWKNAPIVGGGFVSGILFHPAEKSLVYARTDIGGAYRKTASSTEWEPITDWVDQAHWNYSGMESIAIDPSDPKYIYIAAGSYTSDWATSGAILRSANRGSTFQTIPMPFKMGGNEDGRGMGERLVVDPNDGSRLVFGSRRNGLWFSEDRGSTWRRNESFPNTDDTHGIGIETVAFDPASGAPGSPTKTLFAGVGAHKQSLYRSEDAGATWARVPDQPRNLMPHHMVADKHGNLFITYGNGPGPNEVTDGAVCKLNIAANQLTNVSPVTPDGEDKFGYAGLTIDAQHPNVIMVSTLDRWSKGDDLFRSVDGGANWSAIRKKSVRDWSAAPWLLLGQKSVGIGHWISSIQIDPFDSNHLLYDTGWGMWETHDLTAADKGAPTHWKVAAQGIEEGVMNDLISPPAGAHLLSVMWDIDGFRHDDFARSPQAGSFNPHCGGNTSIDYAEKNPQIVCRVYGGQPVGGETDTHSRGAYSMDNGVSWIAFASTPTGGHGDGTIAVSFDGHSFVWTPKDEGTFFSRDNGSTWTAAQGIPAGLRVISDRANPQLFYTCDEHGNFYRSNDAGAHFKLINSKLPTGRLCLKAVPGFQGNLFLASEKGLFSSSDGGKSFSDSPGPTSARLVGFGMKAAGAKYPAIYLVGEFSGHYGFYRSDDQGLHWVRINDDQHQFAEIAAICGDPRIYGRVYIASRSRGTLYGDVAQQDK